VDAGGDGEQERDVGDGSPQREVTYDGPLRAVVDPGRVDAHDRQFDDDDGRGGPGPQAPPGAGGEPTPAQGLEAEQERADVAEVHQADEDGDLPAEELDPGHLPALGVVGQDHHVADRLVGHAQQRPEEHEDRYGCALPPGGHYGHADGDERSGPQDDEEGVLQPGGHQHVPRRLR
jgi:hypothetical protein